MNGQDRKDSLAGGEHCAYDDEDARMFTELMLCRSRQHGVIFLGRDGRIRGWNQGASFITGYAASEVVGRSVSLLFSAEDRERQLDAHELNTARAVGAAEDERWHVRKDGSKFWSTGITLPLGEKDGEIAGFVKIFRDATHLRTRMKYLENVVQECNAHQTERETFIGTIAHELRNPLAPLKTALTLMERLPDPTGRAATPLKIMDRQLAFLVRLVEDLVDLTRVHTGKLSLAYGVITLQNLLNEVIDSCRGAAAEAGVSLHAVLPSVPMEVEVDEERLNQVIVNLLNNAIKFTQRGGGVWLTCTADQTHFLVYVKDNGRGISRELLPKIFDIFTQAHDAHSRRGAGLGIGLAVVKEVVSLHEGTIEVRSEGEGKGAEFIVRIPLRKPRGSQPEPALPRRGS